MKIKLGILLMCIRPFLGNAQAKVELNGFAPFFKDGIEVTLRRIDPSLNIDMHHSLELKTTLENGRFTFSFDQKGAEIYYLTLKKRSEILYIPSGVTNLRIQDSLMRKISIENSTAIEYEKFDDHETKVALKSKYLWLRADYDNYI
ncbi:MAG: hypothetical protein EOO44_05435 [Flavobacterium sp.]|nr:MAG: hypothetical protein EOO44_05435 [Flavobacterium sp.]